MARMRPITNGAIVGTATLELTSLDRGAVNFGGVCATSDGTNACVVQVRRDNSSGWIIFEGEFKTSGLLLAPIEAGTNTIYVSVTGTNAKAVFYEWVD